MKKIKVAILGIAHDHCTGKLDCMKKYPEIFEIVGIVEPNPENVEIFGKKESFQGLKWLSEEEFSRLDDLDAVIVESEELKLVEYAQKCVDRGFHVHIDKPAGEDIGAFETLLRTAKSKKLIVQMAYMYRYNPAIKYCMELVKSGKHGEIYEVDAIMDTEHSKEKREWLGNFKGGIMFFLGCHMVDMVVQFMGMPKKIIPYNKKTSFNNVDAIDHGFAVFEYEKGISTVRSTSTEINGFGRRQLVICGSEGTIELKPIETNIWDQYTYMNISTRDMTKNKEYYDTKKVFPPFAISGRYDDMMIDFAAMVRGEIANPYTYEHELAVQKAILAACGFDIDYKN